MGLIISDSTTLYCSPAVKWNNKLFYHDESYCGGPGSIVGIATGYGLHGLGIESRWKAIFSATVQTGPGAHRASCTMGTGSFPGVKSGRDVTLTAHPLLVPWSRKSTAIPLPPYRLYRLYRASVPVPGYTLTLPLPLPKMLWPPAYWRSELHLGAVSQSVSQSVSVFSVCDIKSDTSGAGRFCTTVIKIVEVRGRKCRKPAIRSHSDLQYLSCWMALSFNKPNV